MKKEMFDFWYNAFGRELALETYPHDTEVDENLEKELRRKAKKIFSSVYSMFSNEMVEKLSVMQSDVYDRLDEVAQDYEIATNKRNKLESSIKEITEKSTKLYDFYFANKIDKEYFDEMKKYYGEMLGELKQYLQETNTLLHNIKYYKKQIESLLITE